MAHWDLHVLTASRRLQRLEWELCCQRGFTPDDGAGGAGAGAGAAVSGAGAAGAGAAGDSKATACCVPCRKTMGESLFLGFVV